MIGIDPDQVHGAGRTVSGVSTPADACCTGLKGAVSDAQGGVHHSSVASAVGRYLEAHVLHDAIHLPRNIEGLGRRVSNLGSTARDGDNEAATVMAGVIAGQGEVSSRINPAV